MKSYKTPEFKSQRNKIVFQNDDKKVLRQRLSQVLTECPVQVRRKTKRLR